MNIILKIRTIRCAERINTFINSSNLNLTGYALLRLSADISIVQNKCSKVKQYLFSVQKQEKKTNQFGAEEQRPKGLGFRQNVATGRGNRGSELNVDDR